MPTPCMVISSIEIHNLRVYDVADGVPDHLLRSVTISDRFDLFMKATPGNYRDALKVAEAEIGMKISCLLSDVYLCFAADLAQEMGVPWVAIRTAAIFSLSLHVYPDHIQQAVPLAASGGPDKFASLFYHIGLMLPRATAVAANSFEELEPTIVTDDLKSKLQNILPVGPFELLSPPPPPSLISDVNGCLQWLDNKREASVAYICFGRIATPPPSEIVALTEALEE